MLFPGPAQISHFSAGLNGKLVGKRHSEMCCIDFENAC